MTLEIILRSFAPDVRTDRDSQELRAYVRSEWRGDASWLDRESSRVALRARFRRWFASRRVAASPARPTGEMTWPAESAVPATEGLVEPCPHPDAQELGLSGGVVFLRCFLCGDVLVVGGGQAWSVGSEPSTSGTGLLQA